ncbi:hypothetical protein DFJ74DRAFT_92534 [Hyaloraphidium curvatum]|nr:hypothetical protein DFJ74DRAFT_92534 [Hyaloraphidium curvatum]
MAGPRRLMRRDGGGLLGRRRSAPPCWVLVARRARGGRWKATCACLLNSLPRGLRPAGIRLALGAVCAGERRSKGRFDLSARREIASHCCDPDNLSPDRPRFLGMDLCPIVRAPFESHTPVIPACSDAGSLRRWPGLVVEDAVPRRHRRAALAPLPGGDARRAQHVAAVPHVPLGTQGVPSAQGRRRAQGLPVLYRPLGQARLQGQARSQQESVGDAVPHSSVLAHHRHRPAACHLHPPRCVARNCRIKRPGVNLNGQMTSDLSVQHDTIHLRGSKDSDLHQLADVC